MVTFAKLFVEESVRQEEEKKKHAGVGKDDIVVTDNTCKPAS